VQYLVRHLTRFVYTSPVCESIMELRMQPLDRPGQQCLRFAVTTSQRARVFAYRDHYGNAVHYFDVPGHHTRLDVSVESAVQIPAPLRMPARLSAESWRAVDATAASADMHDWLAPSHFAAITPALTAFTRAVGFTRFDDPLSTLRRLNATIYDQFTYEPRTTRVDSPIDDALRARAGVCQDFTHIMIALARSIGLPARHVSGYIAPRESPQDRSADNATHAWMEAHLPELGWVGFDPTNNTLTSERHIAVAVGRDYSDVPPTRGVFKGDAGSELHVGVAVTRGEVPVEPRELAPAVSWITPPRAPASDADAHHAKRQQQQ